MNSFQGQLSLVLCIAKTQSACYLSIIEVFVWGPFRKALLCTTVGNGYANEIAS